jgi:hypothetical protein
MTPPSTEPPADETPDDDGPPGDQTPAYEQPYEQPGPPAGGVPQDYPPPPPGYPYYPPPGYPYGPPPPKPKSRIHIGMVFAGSAIYFVINFFIGFAAFAVAGSAVSDGINVALLSAAVLLAVIAFGGGGGLLAVRSPYAKGLGLGLMIGWALTSVFTVGICTGINPEIYSAL